ncbi:ABC transporter permease [Winogradskyella sp. 3972H.M.0a.05]|uniref:ABC transporter permease n=1 Tax=Winogradskyella sp. 3972H.M.0a.05 TaxID=2950277 RepID=UPI00339B0DE3
MNFPLYIAKRYLISKSSKSAINIITIIASLGVIIASAALLIVLSGFAGLKDFSLEFSSVIDPDLKVFPKTGKRITLSSNEVEQLTAIPDIELFSKTVEERVVLTFDGKRHIATIKGVDQNYRTVTQIDSLIPQGNWLTPNSNEVVSGWEISNVLSFGVLDYARALKVSVPKPGKGQISSASSIFNSVNTINVGLFDINEDLNGTYVFADIGMAQQLLEYDPNQISSIEIKLNEGADLNSAVESVSNIFNGDVEVKTRDQLNDALYKMLNTENLIVYLIFTLVIIIALFNVIGAIIMMILDKKQSLQTLYNLGVELRSIKRIFFLQGSLMTIASGVTGLIFGLILIGLQQQFDLVMLTPSLPYPVHLKVLNILLVLVTIIAFGVIASKIASSRITKQMVQP